jgi:uncharacterized protein YcbK (DUF882 family)
MNFLIFFIFNSFSLYSQNIFMVTPSTYSLIFRNSVADVNVKDKFTAISKPPLHENGFTFDDLVTIKKGSNVNENQIKDIEDEDENIDVDIMEAVEPAPLNLGGNGNLTIIRRDTGEKVDINYRDRDGSYDEDEIAKASYIMRCSFDDAQKKVPVRLLELLDAIEDKFGKKPLILLSGYRTIPFNSITPGAAKKSMHLLGWAADIRINGVSSKRIRDYVRKLKIGGVGYYPSMGFVHVDIGRVRYWYKYQYSKKKSYAKKKVRNKKTAVSKSKSLPKKIKISELK